MISTSKLINFLQQCTHSQLKQIHALIITSSLDQAPQIRLKFLRRSTEFGGMEYPALIFEQMGGFSIADVTLWNAMIRGYAYNGPCENALSLFDEMLVRGLKPNNFTYPYLLNSWSKVGNFRIGQKVHCRVITSGFENYISVGNAIFDFYVKKIDSLKLGGNEGLKLDDVRRVFDGMDDKTVELWNKMIGKYTSIGDVGSARKLFDEMPQRDVVSWNTIISGYAKAGDVVNARDLFECIPNKNVVSWTTMLGAYTGIGDIATAKELFDRMPDKNVVSWNSMISGYTQIGKFREAMDLFVQMEVHGICPNSYTFVAALLACSGLNNLELGQWVHSLIKDWPKMSVIMGTALVEMYANCGDIDRSFVIFVKMGNSDVFSYNVMIKSLSLHGRSQEAIKIFHLMHTRNEHSYLAALFACSHGGLVKEGREIFDSMKRDLHLPNGPKQEHYCAMIDILCRNDRLEEAQALLKEMKEEPDIAIWGALLGGCKERRNVKLAEGIVRKACELKSEESGVHVLLSNIHASMGQWSAAQKARRLMEEKGIWKKTGLSSIVR